MKHRVGILETSAVIVGVLATGFGLLVFDLKGQLSSNQQIELLELVVLGALMAGGLAYLGWRRIKDQEREIRARVAAEDRARHLAHHDPLTGLPNRLQLQRALVFAIKIPPSAERCHSLLVLDLNGFKRVNDTFGHPAGDRVLAAVAERLRSCLREGDTLARIGGDEFAIVARDISGAEGATDLALRIRDVLHAPFSVSGELHQIGTGIGIALIPQDGTDPVELLRKADVALYRAKAGRNGEFAFYQPEMDREARERQQLQKDLVSAIGTAQLRPFYQPIMDLDRNKVVSFEALARWRHPTLGELPPDRFIPLAEHTGLISELTDHLLRQACKDAARWPDHIGLSFNLSPVLLHDRSLGERIIAIVRESGFVLTRLELEITENAIVHDLEAAQEVLGSLRQAGVRIALDDFGTGSTSLFHLRSFKFDAIKIDRSFVDMMTRESESAAIVKALLGLGRGLGVDIIAEGIEQVSQTRALRGEGCHLGQGFLYSRAVPADEAMLLAFSPDMETAA